MSETDFVLLRMAHRNKDFVIEYRQSDPSNFDVIYGPDVIGEAWYDFMNEQVGIQFYDGSGHVFGMTPESTNIVDPELYLKIIDYFLDVNPELCPRIVDKFLEVNC